MSRRFSNTRPAGHSSRFGRETNRQSINTKTPQLTIQQRLRYLKQFLHKILKFPKKNFGLHSRATKNHSAPVTSRR
jgi:hypothetical protein